MKTDEETVKYLKSIDKGIEWACIWLFFIMLSTCSSSVIKVNVDNTHEHQHIEKTQ